MKLRETVVFTVALIILVGGWGSVVLGKDDESLSILVVRMRVIVLRGSPGQAPIIGGDEAGVQEVIRHQIEVANQVMSQCHIRIGSPKEEDVVIADPPGPCLLSVGEQYGLPSLGGEVRLMIDGRKLGPWNIAGDLTPEQTAQALVRHIEDAGFKPELTVGLRGPTDAFARADLLVRREDGTLAEIGRWPHEPLTTDSMQSIDIGMVLLDDGLESYGVNEINMGTLEERTLLRALSNKDPGTVEIFIVNRFEGSRKQGESFIASPAGTLGNAAILDWRALGRSRTAYTFAHELGHLLLGDLSHPDSRGDRRTWLLMHSRASSAVGGPNRITEDQCTRMRARLVVNEQ